MCWQVDSPGQGGGADQHLEVAFGKHALHQVSVRPQHPSMVDPKALWEHLLHLLVPGALDLEEEQNVCGLTFREAIVPMLMVRNACRSNNDKKKLDQQHKIIW